MKPWTGQHIPVLTSSPDDDADVIADFTTMSTFGATDQGGVERQAATKADGENRKWLASWLRKRGFRVEHDRIGNMFGLLELTPGAPYVLSGSHLDSQPREGSTTAPTAFWLRPMPPTAFGNITRGPVSAQCSTSQWSTGSTKRDRVSSPA